MLSDVITLMTDSQVGNRTYNHIIPKLNLKEFRPLPAYEQLNFSVMKPIKIHSLNKEELHTLSNNIKFYSEIFSEIATKDEIHEKSSHFMLLFSCIGTLIFLLIIYRIYKCLTICLPSLKTLECLLRGPTRGSTRKSSKNQSEEEPIQIDEERNTETSAAESVEMQRLTRSRAKKAPLAFRQ